MRDRKIFNMFVEIVLLGLLLLMPVSVGATDDLDQYDLSYLSQALYEQSMSADIYLAGRNPWALPPKTPVTKKFNKYPDTRYDAGFKQPERYYDDTGQSEITESNACMIEGDVQPPPVFQSFTGGGFVTPEILNSLKKQQTYFQQTPAYQQYRQPVRRYDGSSTSGFPSIPLSGQNSDNFPPYRDSFNGLKGSAGSAWGNPYGGAMNTNQFDGAGTGTLFGDGLSRKGLDSSNPLYDVPLVSPWGSGPDVIYRGESMPGTVPGSLTDTYSGAYPGGTPWVPSGAMGGLPPIYTPSYEYNEDGFDSSSDIYNPTNPDSYIRENVFNPHKFMPGSNIK